MIIYPLVIIFNPYCIKKTPNENLRFVKSSLSYVFMNNIIYNARSGVRTLDTLIKSQVLCQLS